MAKRGTPSVDAFLGGRVAVVQPAAGHHRSGLEAVLIAATVDADFSGRVVDLGAGSGAAGLCIAARCPQARVVLAERDPQALACARASLALPGNSAFAKRVSVAEVDIGARESVRAEAGLARSTADIVVMNPPFHDRSAVRVSPSRARAAAHVLAEGGLDPWIRAAASMLKPRGRLVAVFRADGLRELVAELGDRFGGLAVLPVYPRVETDAHRVLVMARKGSRAALRLLPPLVLHPPAGSSYLTEATQILRDGAGLADINAAWTLT